MVIKVLALALALAVAWSGTAAAQALRPGLEAATPGAKGSDDFMIQPIAQQVVPALPGGQLFWRVEAFPTLSMAQRAAGPFAMAAEAFGQAWLFTLGPAGGKSAEGEKRVEIGPVPIPRAGKYLLRVNQAGGPPGAKTPVHSHPGSEAFYVLKGQLTQQGTHRGARVNAGQILNGHEPGMAMQLTSSGTEDLQQLVMFVLDAEKPFSTPARFD